MFDISCHEYGMPGGAVKIASHYAAIVGVYDQRFISCSSQQRYGQTIPGGRIGNAGSAGGYRRTRAPRRFNQPGQRHSRMVRKPS
jgi:hypothetical protein